MTMSAPSVPTYNPFQIGQTQQGYNLQDAIASLQMSSMGQQTPFGSLSYTQTGTGPGGVPQYTAKTQLSPEQQALLEQQQQTQRVAGGAAQPLLESGNYGAGAPNLMNMASGPTNFMMGQELNYLSPFFNQNTQQLDTQLRNQGLDPSSEAYKRAMNNLQQSQGQTVSGFLSTAEPQAFQQAMQQYGLPLSTAANLMSLAQPGSLPQNLINTPTGQVQPPNLASDVSASNQAAIAQANLQNQQYQGMLGGMAGLAGTGLQLAMMSDIEAKENIEEVGTLFDKTPVYMFEYKDDPSDQIHIGVMAQDVEKRRPDAVMRLGPKGYKHVDYAKATEESRRIANTIRALAA